MQCVFNFENAKLSGEFSLEILSSDWTTETLCTAFNEGSLEIPFLVDGGPVYFDGRIVAKISKAIPKINFANSIVNYEKNKKIPYFFGFEDKEEVFQYFEEDEFFEDKELILAARHMQNAGYGTLIIFLKDKDGGIHCCHTEDTLRGHEGATIFGADSFFLMTKNDQRHWVTGGVYLCREYLEVIKSFLTLK